MTHRVRRINAAVLALSLGGCALDPRPDIGSSTEEDEPSDHPVAIVRTSTSQWEGEQTYIPPFAGPTLQWIEASNGAAGSACL